MSNELKIFGFGLLRNGIKYDYPFQESLKSLTGVCESIYLALGKGEDQTEEIVSNFPQIITISTTWDESKREGGLILSEQTNIALSELRKNQTCNNGWGLYLQCDEVIHEQEYEKIKFDIEKADSLGCDAVRFRYIHFWQSHNTIAINKKWYPQEIRAVKLDSEIESWGDAQSFRKFKKVFESDAHIFHYGHVRDEDSYKIKKRDILKLYHSDEKISKYQRREKRYDRMTECLAYYGTHPEVMRERILRHGHIWELPRLEKIRIVGNPNLFHDDYIRQINSESIQWHKHFPIFRKNDSPVVVFSDALLDNLLSPSKVPKKMRSKLARDWTTEFVLTLKLSERGIGLVKRKII